MSQGVAVTERKTSVGRGRGMARKSSQESTGGPTSDG